MVKINHAPKASDLCQGAQEVEQYFKHGKFEILQWELHNSPIHDECQTQSAKVWLFYWNGHVSNDTP